MSVDFLWFWVSQPWYFVKGTEINWPRVLLLGSKKAWWILQAAKRHFYSSYVAKVFFIHENCKWMRSKQLCKTCFESLHLERLCIISAVVFKCNYEITLFPFLWIFGVVDFTLTANSCVCSCSQRALQSSSTEEAHLTRLEWQSKATLTSPVGLG